MENTKYQYYTMRVETKQEYKKAKKLLLDGWVALNILNNGTIVQYYKNNLNNFCYNVLKLKTGQTAMDIFPAVLLLPTISGQKEKPCKLLKNTMTPPFIYTLNLIYNGKHRPTN